MSYRLPIDRDTALQLVREAGPVSACLYGPLKELQAKHPSVPSEVLVIAVAARLLLVADETTKHVDGASPGWREYAEAVKLLCSARESAGRVMPS